jgi:hypothetical protein
MAAARRGKRPKTRWRFQAGRAGGAVGVDAVEQAEGGVGQWQRVALTWAPARREVGLAELGAYLVSEDRPVELGVLDAG